MQLRKLTINWRILNYVFWGVTLIVALDLVRTSWLHPRATAAQPGNAYTVTLEQTFTKTAQTRYVNTETYAVRSDGSKMSRFANASTAAHPEMFRTLYLSRGSLIQIRDIAGMTTTKAIQPPTLRMAIGNCLSGGETYVGQELVSGYRTSKVTQGGRTSWLALDYGCALIHERWAFNDGGVTEKNLVSLVPGEPDAALFYVPTGYKEVAATQWRRPYGLPQPKP